MTSPLVLLLELDSLWLGEVPGSAAVWLDEPPPHAVSRTSRAAAEAVPATGRKGRVSTASRIGETR